MSSIICSLIFKYWIFLKELCLLGSDSVTPVHKPEHYKSGPTYSIESTYVQFMFMLKWFFWTAARMKIISTSFINME